MFKQTFRTITKIGLPLIRNLLKPLANSISIPLEFRAVAAATDAAIHKKIFGSVAATLIISIEEMNNIMKIINILEESGVLIKGVSGKLKNETKKQKAGF